MLENVMHRAVLRTLWIVLTVAALSVSTPSMAADDDWKYLAEFYMWGANIDIETEAGTNSEIRFTDIVEDLELAAMTRLATQRGKWRLGADIIYLDIDDNIEDSINPLLELKTLGLEAWIVSPTIGYELLKSERATLHGLVGARYLWIDLSQKFVFSGPLSPGTRKASESDGSLDGTVGIRGEWKFTDKWYAAGDFDSGTGDADSTWQAIVALNYRFKHFDAVAGYRYMDWKDTESDALKDLNLSGFMAGLKFFF